MDNSQTVEVPEHACCEVRGTSGDAADQPCLGAVLRFPSAAAKEQTLMAGETLIVEEILVVEDVPASLKLLTDLLGEAGYAVRQAPNGGLALLTVAASPPELILLDVNMPDMSGYEVCRRLKEDPATRDIPVIFLSALHDPVEKVAGLTLGAVDYICKPFVADEVLARVRSHMSLARMTRQLQFERQTLEDRVRERTADLKAVADALQAEVTVRRATEEKLLLAGKTVDASFNGIMVLDGDRSIVAVNPAFARLTGYRSDELLGQTSNILDAGKHDEEFLEVVWQTVEETGRWDGEIWIRRKDRNIFPALNTVLAVKEANGDIAHYISFILDIAERKDAETLIDFLYRNDALTGLPNRNSVAARFRQALSNMDDETGQIAVLCVDLDRFKQINDLMGHPIGDRVLQIVAGLLSDCLAPHDTVYRQGADEFVVVHFDMSELVHTQNLVLRIIEALNTELDVDGNKITVSASIGVSVCPKEGATLDGLVRNAGTALHRAKELGGNTFAFFTEQMDAMARAKYELEVQLRNVLERRELEIFYQPQVSLTTGGIIGAEALLRWKNPQQGYIPPNLFIPVAEETGQIVAIGEWVLRSVCAQLAAWRARGHSVSKVAVNLSARQFHQDNLCLMVEQVIAESGIPPSCLELEITESAVIKDSMRAIATLTRLMELGVSVAIDDFGTGYSSLSYLRRFPLDFLKVDQSFVRDMLADRDSRAIVLSIISLAHNLRLKVIAEGVETNEEKEYLKRHGCDMMQGYLFSKPVPAEKFAELLAEGQNALLREELVEDFCI